MNCPFCNKEMLKMHPQRDDYNCRNHNTGIGRNLNLSLHYNDEELTNLTYIFAEQKEPKWVYYHLNLFYQSKKTILIYYGNAYFGDLHQLETWADLDYLIDITPETALQCLERFLKLRVYL